MPCLGPQASLPATVEEPLLLTSTAATAALPVVGH